jgi:hypothetical protein
MTPFGQCHQVGLVVERVVSGSLTYSVEPVGVRRFPQFAQLCRQAVATTPATICPSGMPPRRRRAVIPSARRWRPSTFIHRALDHSRSPWSSGLSRSRRGSLSSVNGGRDNRLHRVRQRPALTPRTLLNEAAKRRHASDMPNLLQGGINRHGLFQNAPP